MNKIIRNKLIKEVQDLHTENHKTSLREIKDLNKCKDMPCSVVGILNIVKMEIPLKIINAIPIKICVEKS